MFFHPEITMLTEDWEVLRSSIVHHQLTTKHLHNNNWVYLLTTQQLVDKYFAQEND